MNRGFGGKLTQHPDHPSGVDVAATYEYEIVESHDRGANTDRNAAMAPAPSSFRCDCGYEFDWYMKRALSPVPVQPSGDQETPADADPMTKVCFGGLHLCGNDSRNAQRAPCSTCGLASDTPM